MRTVHPKRALVAVASTARFVTDIEWTAAINPLRVYAHQTRGFDRYGRLTPTGSRTLISYRNRTPILAEDATRAGLARVTNLEQSRGIANADLIANTRTPEIAQFPVAALDTGNCRWCLSNAGRREQENRCRTRKDRLYPMKSAHVHSQKRIAADRYHSPLIGKTR